MWKTYAHKYFEEIQNCLISISIYFSKVGSYGYGGKYGVQTDRKDQVN